MSAHGGHAESHTEKPSGEKSELKDLIFPLSLMKVITKNGLKDFLINMGDLVWKTAVGAISDTADALQHVFGSSGGGHSSGGHAAPAHGH